MNELTGPERYRRMREFPDAIQRLSLDNSLIRRLMEMYAHESILTKEEALCQMVVEMAKNWNAIRKDYEQVMLTSIAMQPRPRE